MSTWQHLLCRGLCFTISSTCCHTQVPSLCSVCCALWVMYPQCSGEGVPIYRQQMEAWTFWKGEWMFCSAQLGSHRLAFVLIRCSIVFYSRALAISFLSPAFCGHLLQRGISGQPVQCPEGWGDLHGTGTGLGFLL